MIPGEPRTGEFLAENHLAHLEVVERRGALVLMAPAVREGSGPANTALGH